MPFQSLTLPELLSALEAELKQQNYWQVIAPDESAFVSELPFCMDKMNGYEWLQWILIPKLRYLIANNQLSLGNFAIYPYFEEVLQQNERDQRLHQLIQTLDEIMQPKNEQLINELSLPQAIAQLQAGEVIAYPTETVFGLGCDPNQPLAIQKLLDLKQRPADKGLILLASEFEFLLPYLDLSQLTQAEIAQISQKQLEPTTWLVPRAKSLSNLISGCFDQVAIRLCDHPIVQALSNALQSPIISTSANKAGQPTCLTIAEIKHQFGADFPVLNGKINANSKPSQIIDLKKNLKLR